MKVLIVSPLGHPVNQETRYAGIETLVYNFTRELKNIFPVSVMGHSESIFPDGVTVYRTDPTKLEQFIEAELVQFQTYQGIIRNFDVIHDFSHQHFAARYMPNLPSLNVFWHAPNEVQYPKAPYNIIGLSKWACRTFKQFYKHDARFQETIALDTDKYKPGTKPRTDRFMTLGVMSPSKGNREAAELCKNQGVPLDICGSPLMADYVAEVMQMVDDKNIIYHGEVDEAKKLELLQTCKALIYFLQRPEVTSHKVQEAMLCGAPVITSRIGALPEIIKHGVNGFLCSTWEEYCQALKDVDKLKPLDTRDELVKSYSIESVVRGYIPLYEKVVQGLRW